MGRRELTVTAARPLPPGHPDAQAAAVADHRHVIAAQPLEPPHRRRRRPRGVLEAPGAVLRRAVGRALTVRRHRSRARGDVEPAAERDLAGRRRSVVRVRHEAPRAPGGKESDAR